MKYRSTRAPTQSKSTFSFKDVLFSPGYAKDGGLYVPDFIPTISKDEALTWKGLDYPSIVSKLLRIFTSADEITDAEIAGVVSTAFKDFEMPDKVVQLQKLDNNLFVAELFRGPTLAFKDLSLALLAKLLEFFLKKEDTSRRMKILVGTSGDTGPAAAHSVANLDRVDLVLLYPLKRVSDLQEMQMLTCVAPNVHVCAVEGTSDDLDVPIKLCFKDAEFSAKHNLGSFNSLQWGRVMIQAAHYIFAYLECCESLEEEIIVVVPTGAAGNLAAGYIAHEMGFAIKLVATVNANDIMARSLQNGDLTASPIVAASLAPAMDIQAPYNIERLLYFATRGNSQLVRDLMEGFDEGAPVTLPQDILEALHAVIIESISVTDDGITRAIRQCYDQYKYVVCPHTATALSYVFNATERSSRVFVCLATASPAKFPEACLKSGMETMPTHPRLESMKDPSKTEMRKPRHVFRRGQDWAAQLKNILLDV